MTERKRIILIEWDQAGIFNVKVEVKDDPAITEVRTVAIQSSKEVGIIHETGMTLYTENALDALEIAIAQAREELRKKPGSMVNP